MRRHRRSAAAHDVLAPPLDPLPSNRPQQFLTLLCPVSSPPIIFPTIDGRWLVLPRRAAPSTRRYRASLPPLLTFSKPEDYRKPRQPLSPNSDGELVEKRIEASEPTCSDRTRGFCERSARTCARDLNICGAHCLPRLLTLVFRLAKEPNLRGFEDLSWKNNYLIIISEILFRNKSFLKFNREVLSSH
jgi:hypothetical protein